jgi:hypothetical protein
MVTTIDRVQWTKGEIAALSDSQLARLNYDEMVDLVLYSGVPLRDSQRIRAMEGDALVRLVYWARQFCRNQAP